MKLKSIQSRFVSRISQAEELKTGLMQNTDDLLELVGAEGVALLLDEEITLIGSTPAESAVRAMVPWLETQFAAEVIYETDSLTNHYAGEATLPETASGILALLISRVQKTLYYLVSSRSGSDFKLGWQPLLSQRRC